MLRPTEEEYRESIAREAEREAAGLVFRHDVSLVDHRTERAAAKRLIELGQESLRWCDPWRKWLVWDDKRWAVDNVCKLESMTASVSELIWGDVADLMKERPDAGTQRELLRYANMMSTARAKRRTPRQAERVRHLPGRAWIPQRPGRQRAHRPRWARLF
jgi:hypothetical protein